MLTAMRKALGFGLATAMATTIVATATSDAAAQQVVPQTPVSTTGKGIAGGALLGGEVGFLGLSAFGARSGWLYATVPTALAIGGGVGGYFIEKNASSAKAPMYMLAGGMALIIPTVVITLTATSQPYISEDTSSTDGGVRPGTGAEPSTTTGTPSVPTPGSEAAPSTGAPTSGPSSLRHVTPMIPQSFALVNFDDSNAPRFSVPAVEVSPMYSITEMAQFGVAQRWQFQAPLVAVNF